MTDGSRSTLQLLRTAKLVFWDFDGVIKDSVSVKTQAFERLFLPYGREVASKVREHHEANGGMSRFDKMPVYLQWAGQEVTEASVQKFCDRFSELALQAVIDAPWVSGVHAYIERHHREQPFVLVTATPQAEIETILTATGIAQCFREVHGSPTTKTAAIADTLARWQLDPGATVFVGDASADLAAAKTNQVTFVLRRTPLNERLRDGFAGPSFDDLEAGS
ncbi:HAD family hydrolase [Steroidobacter flavus]|uniref:phosphoglycolate phosphatase n=1 Tax=Steroidobacter flavus TaxID=1842136 RepID=A0ABV8T0F3_9GAMM